MLPARYELNFYILFRIKSVGKECNHINELLALGIICIFELGFRWKNKCLKVYRTKKTRSGKK
jgi:hypothetical protein